MKLQPQLETSDCLRACIATLLEAPIAAVPNFIETPEEQGGFWVSCQDWLHTRGLMLLKIDLPQNFPWYPQVHPSLCIFFGHLGSGEEHATVGRVEGERFHHIFDPKIELGGLTAVEALGFIVPHDPHSFVGMGLALERIEQICKGAPGVITESIYHECETALGKTSSGYLAGAFRMNGKKAHEG